MKSACLLLLVGAANICLADEMVNLERYLQFERVVGVTLMMGNRCVSEIDSGETVANPLCQSMGDYFVETYWPEYLWYEDLVKNQTGEAAALCENNLRVCESIASSTAEIEIIMGYIDALPDESQAEDSDVDIGEISSDSNYAFETALPLAKQGNAEAQYLVGFMYSNSRGGAPKNDAEAVRWLSRSAEQGFLDAQTYLAGKLYEGDGVPENKDEAVKWYRLAAEQGDVDSQFILGVSYNYGIGITKNHAEAVIWLRKAATQGNELAQSSLAGMYLRGQGVPKDDVLAYAWMSIAAASEKEKSIEFRDDIARTLTAEQLARGQELATRCFESQFKDCY